MAIRPVQYDQIFKVDKPAQILMHPVGENPNRLTKPSNHWI